MPSLTQLSVLTVATEVAAKKVYDLCGTVTHHVVEVYPASHVLAEELSFRETHQWLR